MLNTKLKHLESKEELEDAIKTNENVMICCGRMGPMCIPVYAIMEDLRDEHSDVAFFDQDFDGPAASYIQNLPECATFRGLPFTVYFKNGNVVTATTSIQSHKEVESILDREFNSKQQAKGAS